MHRIGVVGILCLLSCNGAADKKPISIEFGQAVAPPLGLASLRGGESRAEAQKEVAALQTTPMADELVLADAHNGVVAHVRLDHDRVADVVIGIARCDELESHLARSWSQFRRGTTAWSDPKTGWAADFVKKADGCDLRFTNARYFGAHPAPFGTPLDLRIGSSREEAAKIAPAIARGESTVPSRAVIDAKEGVLVDHAGRVVGPYYVLPQRAVEAIRLAWGPASRIPPDESEHWIAPDTRTHAQLKRINEATYTLQLGQYVPLREWLGDGARVAALPDGLWNTPLQHLVATHPELEIDADEPATIMLRPTEWSPTQGTQATLHLDDDHVVQDASVLLFYPTPPIRREMLKAFEAKWGEASEKNGTWTFERQPDVDLQDLENAWGLRIKNPQPRT